MIIFVPTLNTIYIVKTNYIKKQQKPIFAKNCGEKKIFMEINVFSL